MPRILLLPLDERPCNFLYPALMVEKCTDVQLLLPPEELMGSKKRPAPFLLLAQWLGKNFSCCDYAVISIDMLVYGGIVPSRLHHQTTRECLDRLHLLADLRARYPQVKLFAFSLIMRAPCYNSADEEPDYYAEHGSSLFRVGVLRDKIQRNLATAEEKSELSGLEQSIPRSVLSDFCSRRSTNHAVNLQTIFLAEQGVLDFLTIPLDDCALLGWAAAERQQLAAAIRSHALGSRIYSYSGADEAGCILLARAVNHSRGITPSVHICYSSAGAPMVIPRFEDRPLGENLKWLVAAAGGRTCFSLQEADYILVVNAPTEGQSAMGDAKSPAPHSAFGERCLPDLAANLRALAAKKPVILADLAVTNGADREWMDLLQQQNLLKTLYAYAGWNTAANAAGCCIAQGMLCGKDSTQSALFTCHRILEDWLYMSLVRRDVAAYAQRKGLSFDGSWQEQLLAKYVTRQMCRLAKGLSLPAQVEISQISFPWHRPFEIELFIQLSAPSKAGM